ncbi:MAG: hypothetical protein IIC06_07815, partial [Proteobacteria bacterium]|nr:hypothetical protein [Pseudomonadota bacterium]
NSGMDRISYKGFDISPAPREMAGVGEWSLEVWISCEEGGRLHCGKFFASNTFPTKEQAIQHCHDFARRLINRRGDPFDGERGPLEFKP